MYYIQFYNEGVFSKELIEVCGDRGVIIIDGRSWKSLETKLFAAEECRKRNFKAYSIWSGPTFTRSYRVTKVTEVSSKPFVEN